MKGPVSEEQPLFSGPTPALMIHTAATRARRDFLDDVIGTAVADGKTAMRLLPPVDLRVEPSPPPRDGDEVSGDQHVEDPDEEDGKDLGDGGMEAGVEVPQAVVLMVTPLGAVWTTVVATSAKMPWNPSQAGAAAAAASRVGTVCRLASRVEGQWRVQKRREKYSKDDL